MPFLAWVEYDAARFEYLRVRESAALQSGVTTTVAFSGRVGTAYTAYPHEDALSQPEESLTYRFRLREGADPGEAEFFVSVYQIVDLQPQYLGHDTDQSLSYQVLEPPSSDASLLGLVPENRGAGAQLRPPTGWTTTSPCPMRSSSSPSWRNRRPEPAAG